MTKKPDIELLGFEDQTGIFHPLEREVEGVSATGSAKIMMVPVPSSEQISFMKKLRSNGVKGKLKPRYQRLRSKRKALISRVVQDHA